METYPVDIDPRQIVRWVKAESEGAPATFRIDARRTTEVREIPLQRERHLGDAEREDLSEIATIATLEIAPAHASDGWLLRIIIEDEAGPRVSSTNKNAEGEQRIDLGTLYHEFIRPGRGTANITAEVTGPAAKQRLTRLLNAIETNRPHLARR